MNRTNPRDGERPRASVDLEARVVVLEIVSMTALAFALDTSENADAEHAKGIANLILETVSHRCDEMGLSQDARHSASAYADELLSTALVALYPGSPRSH